MDKIIFGAGAVGQALLEQCKGVVAFCDEGVGQGPLSIKQAKRLKLPFLIATSAVKDVKQKLSGCWILHKETIDRLKRIPLKQYDIYTQWCILNCIDANKNWNNKSFLRSLDVIITERCSLRCRDCSNLMQYYTNPQNEDLKKVYYDFDIFLKQYTVGEVRIIGGETFVHPEWEYILDKLIQDNRVKRIVVYTNGTIIPRVRCLTSDKVLVLITNYGQALSRKVVDIMGLFDVLGINYHIVYPEWTACGKIEKHNRTRKENDKIYDECCSHNVTLSKGKLYACAFSANLARLGIYDVWAACEYCNGRPFNAPKITPAIQRQRGKDE